VQELNRRFRRKNKPKDVLSFPREQGGDIAISAEIALENARRYGHSAAEEIKILVLHGMLHLSGYDHESDNGRIAAREARLRAQLRLPDSLIERTHAKAVDRSRPRLYPSTPTHPFRKERETDGTRKAGARRGPRLRNASNATASARRSAP